MTDRLEQLTKGFEMAHAMRNRRTLLILGTACCIDCIEDIYILLPVDTDEAVWND